MALVCGLPGCLAGDTIIRVNRCSLGRKFNLKWMFNQFHDNVDKLKNFIKWDLKFPTYVRSYNGKDIRLHKINDVVYSGKKELYLLELDGDTSIKATADHKIMLRSGNFIELKDLKEGISLMPFNKVIRKGYFYVYDNTGKRRREHEMIFEHNNGPIGRFGIDNPNIHHIDENKLNNNITNLQLTPVS